MSKPNSSYPVLENLFNSRVRIKVLKFLFRNYPVNIGIKDLSKRVQESLDIVRKEINALEKMSLIKKVGKVLYAVNPDFEFFKELRELILKSSPAEKSKMIKRITGLGRVKFAVASGILVNSKNPNENIESEVDLFIVGDDVNKAKLNKFLRSLEAEVGKEIRFGVMEKDEFEYRYGMFDRFVRVLLENPHEKLINKLGL